MKKLVIISTIFILALTLWFNRGGVDPIYKDHAPAQPLPENYEPTILWPKTEEDQQIAGEASGVAVNSNGDIYYLHRGSSNYGGEEIIKEPTIIVLDGQTLEVKDKWGENRFSSPHGLEIDHEDNIWITDISLNKVYKFSPDGKLVQEFGDDYPFYMEVALRIRNKLSNFPTGMSKSSFARPTDVTVLQDGSFVVSDGYRNRRIVKFDKNGQFLWEKNKLGSGAGEFNLPHGISSDEQHIYVADRSNARVQIFTHEGDYIEDWDHNELGRPFGIEADDKGSIYLADGGDSLYPENGDGTHQIVILNKDGQIKQRFGTYGTALGELNIPHDIAVDQKRNIYVAELRNNRLQMFESR
ncbi:peptidyl-alpha-hydroxyglycine alpha-amidating lyase family protein [Sutcliffiella horikoshii]|uniref:peptidyl-alpha-hydroxyglycine alpha-amidating lyase family protein n=1 Tax=Sutcliffiella horikoshii TaxID=79883 RepID=UPI00384EDB1B